MSYGATCEHCTHGHTDHGYGGGYDHDEHGEEEFEYHPDFYYDDESGFANHCKKKKPKLCPPPRCPQIPCTTQNNAFLCTDSVVPPPSIESCKCPQGNANGLLDKCCTAICIRLRAHDLSSEATAFIYDGAIGENGDLVKTVPLGKFCKETGHKGHGCNCCPESKCLHGACFLWTKTDDDEPLTQQLVEKFVAGLLYIQINTETNPNGELRGQLLDYGFKSHRSGH